MYSSRLAAGPAALMAPLFRLEAHTKPVADLALLPKSGQLASCSPDHCLIFWDYATQSQVQVLEHPEAMHCIVSREDKPEVLVGTQEGSLLRFTVPCNTKVIPAATPAHTSLAQLVLLHHLHCFIHIP
jgi:WD40 repeat protein